MTASRVLFAGKLRHGVSAKDAFGAVREQGKEGHLAIVVKRLGPEKAQGDNRRAKERVTGGNYLIRHAAVSRKYPRAFMSWHACRRLSPFRL
jgi:hypothetical protein